MNGAGSDADTFVLSAGPPVRALAIAAGAAVVGAALIVGASTAGWSVALVVLGAVILALGVALAVAGLLFVSRLRTTVVAGQEQLVVRRRGQTRQVAWAQIADVRLRQARLTITVPGEQPVVLVNLRRPGDPAFSRLLVTLQQRLDADRGYGN